MIVLRNIKNIGHVMQLSFSKWKMELIKNGKVKKNKGMRIMDFCFVLQNDGKGQGQIDFFKKN